MTDELYLLVKTALDNAVENEYDEVKTNDPMTVTIDLMTYSADVEDEDETAVLQCVVQWQEENR